MSSLCWRHIIRFICHENVISWRRILKHKSPLVSKYTYSTRSCVLSHLQVLYYFVLLWFSVSDYITFLAHVLCHLRWEMKDERHIRKCQNTWLVYNHTQIENVRSIWPLAHIFLHFGNIQYEYLHHIFLAFEKNAPAPSVCL